MKKRGGWNYCTRGKKKERYTDVINNTTGMNILRKIRKEIDKRSKKGSLKGPETSW